MISSKEVQNPTSVCWVGKGQTKSIDRLGPAGESFLPPVEEEKKCEEEKV